MSNTEATEFFYLTAEVRWFLPGRIPEEILQWFGSSAFPLIPTTRTDRYLVYPSSEQVGVKFREERIEVKAKVRDLDLLDVGDHIKGKMELWEKWSAGADSVPLLFRDISGNPDHWIDVTKTRWMRLFRAEGEKVTESDPGSIQDRPPEGCYAEITGIEVGDRSFWTLGLESFGDEESLEATVTKTAQFLLHPRVPHHGLIHANSFAYPAFLRMIRMAGSSG